jgi:hypothetical protein
MVFYVTPGVNADKIVAKDGRLCKVSGAPVRLAGDIPPVSDNQNEGPHDKARSSWPVLYQGKGLPPKMAGMPKLSGVTGSSAPAKGAKVASPKLR